ncbi:MAG: AraC family transcriptional regulator [Pseudomonadales bacterium]|nr:AraC family transcriptional regulator [Pseudomonadales bacterium]
MNFTPYQPSATISPYIESIFHYSEFYPDHSIERVVPTGHLFIIFELDGITRYTYDANSLKPNAEFSKAWISGMHKNFISISAHENSEMFVVQFKPFGSYPFLHRNTCDFNEQVIPAHAVVGDELYSLRERMLSSDGAAAKFSLAEDWLLSRFDSSRVASKELVNFIGELQLNPVEGLNDLIDGFPGSQKKLIDDFKRFVGLTPKSYQRVLRFNDLLKRIQHKDKITWADIAHDCGYFDQSHFIKEFKYFSGMNPEEFIQQDFNKDEPNFFPLDRDASDSE